MPHTNEGTGFRNTDTSALAALEIDGTGRAGNLRSKVYGALLASSVPLSTGDLCRALAEEETSVRPRVTELRDRRLVEDTGLRGKTRFNRSCILWRAVKRATPETPNPQEESHG